MEKIAINPNRLQWCCDILDINIDYLGQHTKTKIATNTLKKALQGSNSLSINQLENIAEFFNRSLLFFINLNPVNEELIYSPQFRTINNQKPLYSHKINALVERVEQHRKVYLNLLEDLDNPIVQNWHPRHLNLSHNHIKQTANIIRQWLGVTDNLTFNELRALVEAKGVMVFVSNGYNGAWQINKENKVRGFALYYDTLPIIVIKKQTDGAKAFTLMHELAHLLLHQTSIIDQENDFYNYTGKEKEANEFASSVLITDEELASIDLTGLQNLDIDRHDDFLAPFKYRWCASNDAILYRLLREHKITQVHYQAYKELKDKQYAEKKAEEERKKLLPDYQPPIRKYRHREPLHIFGKPYVATVLDALNNKHITLTKASTHLDNLKIHTLHKLEGEFVPF